MSNHVCFIVPPYLLQDLAEAGEDPEARRLAAATLAKTEHIHRARKQFFADKLAHGPHSGHGSGGLSHDIVPDYILEDLSIAEGVDEEARRSAEHTLAVNRQLREQRVAGVADTGAAAAASAAPAPANFTRSVYDMENREDKKLSGRIDFTPSPLPGKLVRAEGQPASKDKNVNESYDNCLKVLQFYKEIFNYTSLDGQNMPVVSSVHYEKDYQNAAWYGLYRGKTLNQMVYGDGAGVLYNFTNCLDVMGHEITVSISALNFEGSDT
jgi:Zn-dependent metalloprotease